jgi:hypothetical protein
MPKGENLAEYNKKTKTMPIEEVREKLYSAHEDMVTIDESTYKKAKEKARFIDKEYGEFWAEPLYVINRGWKHPQRQILNNRISIEEIKERLYKKFKDLITIDESTYRDTHTKARFADKEYGEFWRTPKGVILLGYGHPKRTTEKRKQTCFKRYGVGNPNQSLLISKKQARSTNNRYIKFHWKTNEEIVCVGSYEAKTVEYLNKNRIEFEWQPKVFQTPIVTPTGLLATYRPDLFLINEYKWVEIKGNFRKDAQEKWDWFKSEYSNSELWNENRLKEIGIL